MEEHHKKTSSRDNFSLPSTPSPDQDSDFEFGSLTPDSPSNDPCKTSPADQFFSNGRLLPHSFPFQQKPNMSLIIIDNISRATSRTSSVSSKDSLMSSRSNSTNSSRSSASSARTSSSSSSSENSERRLLYHHRHHHPNNSNKVGSKTPTASKVVMAQLYGSSQRWQHIMPVAVLKREDSRRNNGGNPAKAGLRNQRKGKEEKKEKPGICMRFFRSLLVACSECHAMEPSKNDGVF